MKSRGNGMLKIKKLKKNFGDAEILKDIDLEIKEGEMVAIMGPSGSGKSTLLYNISGMDKPTGGEVIFDNMDLSKLTDEEISDIRLKKMGFIFQNSHLLKNFTIKDNIILPGFKAGLISREDVLAYADEIIEKVGIDGIKSNDINKVSGGQLQRAAICRALINKPRVIFGDEPTGALNSSSGKEVMDILNKINDEGTTIVISTHDIRVAARTERIVFLKDGRILDELNLEKYDEKEVQSREKLVTTWLEKNGF